MGARRANPNGCRCTTSPTGPWASTPRPSPMGSTTSPTTKAGSPSATSPTPPSSRSSPSAAGGTRWAETRFPDADRLLITADAGGSNGYRLRAWKVELARLAAETGLRITVCHYPPGTSKWNRIEHRMFSFITMNWRGRPLTTLRTIIELISATSHHHRAHHPSRLRPELVPHRRQDHRHRTRRRTPPPPRLPRRMELHHHRATRPDVSPKATINDQRASRELFHGRTQSPSGWRSSR